MDRELRREDVRGAASAGEDTAAGAERLRQMETVTTRRVEAFRWDRLTISIALGYCLLVVALSAGVVLGELRSELHISGVIAACA